MPRRSKAGTTNGPKGSRFTQYFAPALEALKSLGGSGRPSEVMDYILKNYHELAGPEQMEILQKTGGTRFSKDIHFARLYLAQAGYIGSSHRGVWKLTEKGSTAVITPSDAIDISKRGRSQFGGQEPDGAQPIESEEAGTAADGLEPESYRGELMELLKGLPASGFERLCQEFLRVAGFEKVNVTGRSGDGGIDGEGVLVVNALVSFKVLFQCKKYKDSVSPGAVRDFRGAMEGRAEKGIIITTGTFTQQAKDEAARDGAPPIELVEGEKLIGMFEQLELGLTPVKTYKVDRAFFEAFK